jgi:hypothetical protein
MLVELVMAIGLAAIILPALLTGLVASREGRPAQQQRAQATELLKETANAVRNIRDTGWSSFSVDGTYHPVISSNQWTFASNSATTNGFTQQVVVSDVYRSTAGAIVTSGGTLDPSTKKADITISWTQPQLATISASMYLTRTTNLTSTDTTTTDFNAGVLSNTQVTNTSGGEVELANNNKAKWCSPAFATDANNNEISITLPDGPPVAVAATASAVSTSIPNDVFVATAPYSTSSAKLAYVTVTANTATPSATLKGTFTLDSTKYSAGTYPTGIGTITNSFKTNDVKYYYAPSGNVYALLATDDPNHEVVVSQIKSGGSDSYQDPINHIYKYWTFFNTKINSSASTNDQSPYGYGAVSIAVLGTRGYVISGGYLYVFDLSNIDTATKTTSLPELGCRIELDGYDCQPGTTGHAAKYDNGDTGTTFSDTATPIHNDCSDGGNIELHADNDIAPIKVGSSTYVYVAVGGVTNPEFEIANVTTVPTGSGLTSSTCGTSSGTSTWRRTSGTLDFNPINGTEEASNSVFAKSDGTRAYVTSNGGIDGNGDGKPDSQQFYIINTSNKNAPAFLSTNSDGTAKTGYYNGGSVTSGGNTYANDQLYPRRSLTVQNGDRAVLVGKDGVTDNKNAQEYQVLDMVDSPYSESAPGYCGGLDFDQGFNDLTSVSELDNDNYVYMIANTTVKELKIIQGGPDNAIYVTNGTFTSKPFDTASVDGSQSLRAFNRFLANLVLPTNTTLTLQTAVAAAVNNSCTNASYSFAGPDGTASTQYTATGSAMTGIIPLLTAGSYQNPGRCFKYKVSLGTTDQTQTPVLNDMTWNYSQ